MANFCMKCGTPLDTRGLCPHCDIPAKPTFCTKCGTPLGADGRCPHCDAPAMPVTPVDTDAPTVLLSEEEGATVPLSEDPGATVLLSDTAVVTAEQAAPVWEPMNPPEAKPAKKGSAITAIVTVLLSLCLFITTTTAVGVLTVRHTISEGGMENLAEQVDIAEMLKTTGAANGETFDTFYQRLERDYGAQLDDEKLGELLEDSTVPEYVADKISDFADDFFAGEAELVVTKDEMVDLLWENRELIEEEIPDDVQRDRLYQEDCEVIADWMFNGEDFVLLSTDDLRDDVPVLYQSISIGLSYLVMAFFLVLSALILFAMCRNSLSQAAIGSGTVFILLGGMASLAAAVVAWIPGLWASVAGQSPVLSLLGSVLVINAPTFVIMLAVGILLLVLRAVIQRVKK